MIPVIFAPQADEELEDIGDYIAKDSPAAALRVVAELRGRAGKIGHMLCAYRRGEDLAPGLRALSWRSYVVLFQITSSYRSASFRAWRARSEAAVRRLAPPHFRPNWAP